MSSAFFEEKKNVNKDQSSYSFGFTRLKYLPQEFGGFTTHSIALFDHKTIVFQKIRNWIQYDKKIRICSIIFLSIKKSTKIY